MLLDALTLQLGYNATLVAIGAALLGAAAGATGTFLFLQKRALVSDAISHATLPGVGIAFILMVALGGDGRWLPGLLIGSAMSALLGLLVLQWITRASRLTEDAAIGAVLSVFFGFGIVLLTVIQAMPGGRQSGLDSLLLGSTAGMLMADATLLAAGAVLSLAAVLAVVRPVTLTAFDPAFAAAQGISVERMGLVTMGLALCVTVVGLKVVGLILIVALLVIPPVTARFWTEQAHHVVILAGGVGAVAAYVGAAISAIAPALPTGPIIVLVAFALFALSMLLAPGRGMLAAAFRHRTFQADVHRRQGLLALAQGQPIYERRTHRLLFGEGLLRADGVATDEGRARAAKALLDERRWEILRGAPDYQSLAVHYDGLTPIETVLTPDQIADIDRDLGGPVPA